MNLSVEKQDMEFKIAVIMDPVQLLIKKDLVRCQVHILAKSID